MAEPARINPREASRKIESGDALLVCGYEDEGKFRDMHLDGAISLQEFESRLPNLSKDQEIIFYCA